MKKKKIAAAIIGWFILLTAGGITSVIVEATDHIPATAGKAEMYSAAVCVLLVAIVVIEISSAFKIHDSTIHTVFTSFAIMLCYTFSSDMQNILNPANSLLLTELAEYVNFIAFHLIILSHIYLVNYIYKSGIKKKEGVGSVVYSFADCILYFILAQWNLQYIAYIAYLPSVIYLFARICGAMIKKRNYDITYVLIISILFAALGMYVSVFLFCSGLCKYHIYGIETTYILVIVLLYISVYFVFISQTERKALAASEYKLNAEKMKTRMLREQINPHFIFNSLITVKEAYHRDIEKGDRAMNFFSHYLRANVEAMNLDLIPFGDELDIIDNYIGLENMKREKPVNIIYDVEYDGFNLPVLSLQVFVENAVKYARTEDKEDGYILISSRKCPKGATVEIIDNGIGFDVNNIKENSCGIKNAKERFKLLLNTDVSVESTIGQGTKITVTIPEELPPPPEKIEA